MHQKGQRDYLGGFTLRLLTWCYVLFDTMSIFYRVSRVTEVSFFTWRGAPENWGHQILFLQSKGGIKRYFKLKGGITYIFKKKQNILLNISDSRERDCQIQLGDENSNGTFQVNVKTFSYIFILMLISHNLRRNVEGTRITLVKPQFLCDPPSIFYGYKSMTDTTDVM